MELTPTKALATDGMCADLAPVLADFAPISLAEMGSVSLMRRIDTKYVIHQASLPAILAAVADRYAVLEIDGRRAMRYASQYFDTPTCRFYHDHHNGRAKRTKIRIRSYVDSDTSFLEIKRKSADGVTSKHRIPCEAPTSTAPTGLPAGALEFIGDVVHDRYELQPTANNRFRRITLVDSGRGERVTIDCELSSHLATVDLAHPNLVIVEIKQEGLDRHAPIMAALKSFGYRPYRISKYCLGMACLWPHLKTNRFKRKLLHVSKVTSEARH